MKHIRFFSIILAITFTMQLFADTGDCGKNLKWNFYPKNGKLEILGIGSMTNYSPEKPAPWAKYADKVKSLSIDKDVTYLGDYAFYGCKNLKSVMLPKKVESIGASCFEGCTALSSFKFKMLYRVGKSALGACPNLKAIEFGGYCTVGQGVQHSSPKVTWFHMPTWSKKHTSLSGVLYDKDLWVLIQYPTGYMGATYKSFPQDLVRIGSYSFAGNPYIHDITIPEGVKYIGDGAFEGCTNLEKITLPSTLISLGKNAFKGCPRLKSVVVPDSVSVIEDGTFALCDSLREVTLPVMLTKVGSHAFTQCKQLQALEFPARTQTLGKNTLAGCKALATMAYPHGMKFEESGIRSGVELEPYNSSFVKGEGFIVKRKDAQPPKLEIVPNSVVFADASGNNRIDARERGLLRFKVKNVGAGGAYDCEARIALSGDTIGIHALNAPVADIPAGGVVDVEIPVWSDRNTKDGSLICLFEVFEPQGFGISTQQKSVPTHKFINPFIQIDSYTTDAKANIIPRRKPFTLTCTIKNIKEGVAQDIHVELKLPYGVMVWDGETKHHFDLINGGESKKVTYTLVASALAAPILHFDIDLTESEGQFAQGKSLDIQSK